MAGSGWDPLQYGRFAAQRSQPFWDLVAMIRPSQFALGVDLGCGAGELTAAVAAHLDIGAMVGIDSSASMLAAAGSHARPGLEFAHGEIGAWTSAGETC